MAVSLEPEPAPGYLGIQQLSLRLYHIWFFHLAQSNHNRAAVGEPRPGSPAQFLNSQRIGCC
jgi:hypothetical protein